MNTTRPTLAELRQRVHKERHREIGNWLARKVTRPSAVYGTWLAVRLGLSANQVTLAALFSAIGGAIGIATGGRIGFVAGVLLAHLSFWLDRVDGQVARWRGTASLDGVYLDYLMHHASNLVLGFALGYGLAARTGRLEWTIAGFAIAVGWAALSLHNDCRYKAFFQRLKREEQTYRVDSTGRFRPAPPAPWPRRGRGAVTWPAYKACEPHVVLLGLTVLAMVAAVNTTAWEACWMASVLGMSILAPVVACGRIARSVMRGTVEEDFGAWFAATSRAQDVDVRMEPNSVENDRGAYLADRYDRMIRGYW